MPSKNPRLSVVLSPSLAATLAAVSQETGESASSLVRGLLVEAEPALQRMVNLLRAANGAKHAVGAGLGGTLERVVADLEGSVVIANAKVDAAVSDLVSQAEGPRRRRRAVPASPATGAGGGEALGVGAEGDPRAVTRGSGSGKTRTRR